MQREKTLKIYERMPVLSPRSLFFNGERKRMARQRRLKDSSATFYVAEILGTDASLLIVSHICILRPVIMRILLMS